jgi:hypothetical protein
MDFETFEDYQRYFEHQKYQLFQPYIHGQSSFIPRLLPQHAQQLSTPQVSYLLERRFGVRFWEALNPEHRVDAPTQYLEDTQWLKRSKMVGINVRTLGNFWNIIKYSFTLPKSYDAIHLLPIWECGVVASLYAMASWNINPEFFSDELAQAYPHLNTVEKQLKAVVNILHLQGRTVGMDVIPHTDRYSEIVLANPSYFEWLRRDNLHITNHSDRLYLSVQQAIINWLMSFGTAKPVEYFPNHIQSFFSDALPESERLELMFGEKWDLQKRTARRNNLIQFLYNLGLEPVPATMGPPYRGLKVDDRESAKVVDQDGRVWRDYLITEPQQFSRVFGPLTRYKLHESLDENRNWGIDFEQPRTAVFDYVCRRYAACALDYNFDFMRGDMSHVQMRALGVPESVDVYYDIHKCIKKYIGQSKKSFGYYAESFLAPDGEMAYGSEPNHLERSDVDVTLGNLQSMVVGNVDFQHDFQYYIALQQTRTFAPCFTIMTSDKDDPRFDVFYQKGNELRAFIGFFLTSMPSYTALGFECRDLHLSPAPNEHYTKLYVFSIDDGKKATHGAYTFGKNIQLFNNLLNIKTLAENILPIIEDSNVEWLLPIQQKAGLIAWQCSRNTDLIFVVNLDLEQAQTVPDFMKNMTCIFSIFKQDSIKIVGGECRLYQKQTPTES